MGTSDSLGIIAPQLYTCCEPLSLVCGKQLEGFDLVFETYGALNTSHSNAVLICHALSGDHHAAGYHGVDDKKPGWWNSCIGPGKAIDTNKFFVVSLNNLGGCAGSTGPLSINPTTGVAFGPDFPQVTVCDWVESQRRLAVHLGIEKFAAIIGGSLGGMQVMEWATRHPQWLHSAVVIAAASKLSAQNIAFNEIARQAIVTDREYQDGHYRRGESFPERGLGLARMLGHVTYLSDDGMKAKFDRALKSGDLTLATKVEFQVESYLHHQAANFSKSFDANTYILMTRALDLYNAAGNFDDDLTKAFAESSCRYLVISFSSDWRFSPGRSKEIVDALVAAKKDVTSVNIESVHGHDSFLLPIPRYLDVLAGFLNRLAGNLT